MKTEIPIVAIIGRQNVGKSTLFNALVKTKKAIVDPHPGLTRDIISCTVNYESATFALTDTPGLDLDESAELAGPILSGARAHLERASVIIFLLENPHPHAFDLDLADMLRKLSIPTIIAVNKMDDTNALDNMVNFYEMGFNDILPISALNRFNLKLLIEKITDFLPSKKTALHPPDARITIIGRPNSGKSTLLNALIGYERAVVSEIPGTTRDSVDEEFMFKEKKIRIIDTAGIRRKSHIKDSVEFYSLTRTLNSLRDCDVAIHLIDAVIGLTENDKKIADEIVKAKKPMIIAVNKWDAVTKDHKTFEEMKDKLIFKFYKAEDFPIISISARDKQRIHKLIEIAVELAEKAHTKIETSRLNKVLATLQSSHRIPQLGGKIKILYATQIGTIPPQFKFFVNNEEYFRKDTIRYFEKALKEEFNLEGIPVIIHLEGRKKKPKK